MSTASDASERTVERKRPNGVVEDYDMPAVVDEYNHGMNNVDVLDQEIQQYTCYESALKPSKLTINSECQLDFHSGLNYSKGTAWLSDEKLILLISQEGGLSLSINPFQYEWPLYALSPARARRSSSLTLSLGHPCCGWLLWLLIHMLVAVVFCDLARTGAYFYYRFLVIVDHMCGLCHSKWLQRIASQASTGRPREYNIWHIMECRKSQSNSGRGFYLHFRI